MSFFFSSFLLQTGRLTARSPGTTRTQPGAIDDDKEALLAEAALVSGVDHPNVESCLGQISIGDPKIIVFEFMAHGSLLGWLEEHGAKAALKTKLKMAIDIARGMQYLSNLRYVHRVSCIDETRPLLRRYGRFAFVFVLIFFAFFFAFFVPSVTSLSLSLSRPPLFLSFSLSPFLTPGSGLAKRPCQ